jgi:hypothetical protein
MRSGQESNLTVIPSQDEEAAVIIATRTLSYQYMVTSEQWDIGQIQM